MGKRSIPLLVGALAIVGSLVVGPAATAGAEHTSAGTVVFIHEQEPPSLRGGWLDNNLLATGLVTNNIWYGGQIYDKSATLQPRLFEGKPKLVKKSPLTISFEYKASAVWSDGKPITCEDWKATWRVFVNTWLPNSPPSASSRRFSFVVPLSWMRLESTRSMFL